MLALLVGALLFVAACDDGPTEIGADARLSLLLTDAPGDVAAVWVEITEVSLRGSGAEESNEIVILDGSTGLVELTALVSTTRDLVTDAAVEPGTYSQLRLVIGGAVLETEGGAVFAMGGATHPDGLPTTGELKCPSCGQSGLKVNLPGGALDLEDGDNVYVLDFDVSQTFGHEAGNSGNWVMRPVIHAAKMTGSEVAVTGTVVLATDAQGSPVVTLPECPPGSPRAVTDFLPLATAVTLVGDQGPIVRTGVVNDQGEFRFSFLAPDDYALGFESVIELSGFDLVFEADVEPATVTVDEGSTTGVVYTITAATCEASS